MAKKQYSMVIDLHACVGCAACDIACKCENNVPASFSWANHIIETHGTFPNVRYRHIPTLCNHCSNAPCVANCPTTAMHKTDEGITMHDADKCIGCGACRLACPYGVIYYNDAEPHHEWQEEAAAIPNCTAAGSEVSEKCGTALPYYNPARADTLPGVRPKGVVEKCTFCDHRLAHGEEPACVEACPTGARLFGDVNDPRSEPAKAIAKHSPRVLQPEKGTRPNVIYIRDY
ncbi:MAG: 4Fe-4S dicluster domain-containing protein [Planctomycetes bacterium]|nr:4Fe-4S dicluster domain-containing protein [Planctomycetota bacterium]NOG55927.1 4Fe-4S dicluster domain-containing protein [Planctomycetota bacterium]